MPSVAQVNPASRHLDLLFHRYQMKDVPAGLVADPEHPSRLQLHHIWKEVASPRRALCPRCASYDMQSVSAIRSLSAAENGYSIRSHQRYRTQPRPCASPGRDTRTGLHLTLGGERGLAVLTIDLYRTQAPVFFSRRVNCAHRLRNAWKRRTVSTGRIVSACLAHRSAGATSSGLQH